MPKEVPERRFAFGRMVKSAAPPADVVQQILEKRNAVRNANSPDEFAEITESNIQTEMLQRVVEPQAQQIEQIADGLGQLFDLVVALHNQDAADNKAFDMLHAELSDYKNDFFYERLKPFARQLLFVCDALDQYGQEVADLATQGKTPSASDVQENIAHCAAQLKDALLLIEIESVPTADGEFDPKAQRAVEVESVPVERDKQVVRQVRAGWMMGSNLLRSADVVVGKSNGR